MTRSELITRLAQRFPQFVLKDAETAVSELLNSVQEALVRGDRVEIRGFGSFGTSTRPPRLARNPKTGEPVPVPAKRTVSFKAGKELRHRVMAAASPSEPLRRAA